MATFTAVSAQDLKSFLAAYDLRLRSFGGVPAGSVNSNYWLEVEFGENSQENRLFLRIFEEQGPEGAAAEAAMLERLAAARVPTPAPLRDGSGQAIGTLAGKPAALFPWRQGGMRCQASLQPHDLDWLGDALALVHVVPGAGEGRGPGRFGLADLHQRIDRIAGAKDEGLRSLAAPLRDALDATAARRRKDLPRGLVHGDLFRDNVLWRDELSGPVVALLDFESAFEGPLAYDIAVCLLSWCYGEGFDPRLARALVRGYCNVRPLDAAERDGLFEEARFGALRFTITRITDYAMRASEGPRVVKDHRRFWARYEALGHWGAEHFDRDLFGDCEDRAS